MDSLTNIWTKYRETNDPALRDRLILEYAHLVKYCVGRLGMHLGTFVEYEDLVSYGIFGLIDAIDRFDITKGVKFETYAALRIKGSIIDSIRKMDWIPRSLRTRQKQLEHVYSKLENELGREPTEDELSQKLGISVEEVQDLFRKAQVFGLISLDEYLEQNNEPMLSPENNHAELNPEKMYSNREVRDILKQAIEKLSRSEQMVLSLYYFDELTQKEISASLNVSESRVSQIHSKALFKLSRSLGRHKSILFDT